MIGKEMGAGPFASLRGIYISQSGSIELKASLISAIIANNPRYSYHMKTSTKEACEIDFYDSEYGSEPVGTSSFTIDEARQAGLLNKDPKYNPWVKYTTDMLFNRALSRGARRFCPGAFAGVPVYVSGETESLSLPPKEAPVIFTDISDEAIIEEFKQTNVINEEFR